MRLSVIVLVAAISTLSAAAKETDVIDPRLIEVGRGITASVTKADDAALVGFGTRNIFSAELGPDRGVVAARDWIAAQFREIAAGSGGRMTVDIDSWVQPADNRRIPHDVTLYNVLATLKGSEAGSRTYVLSSHYDTINSKNEDDVNDAPGADDDASGVVAVIEAARALAKFPTRATIIFAAYSSEEQGLFGSAHHAAALKQAGIDVEGDINDDIVGASVGPKGERNPNRLRIFSQALPDGADPVKIALAGAENDSPSRELARFAKEVGDQAAPPLAGEMIYRADRYLRGGDHMSFNKVGFPSLRFVEPVEGFEHQHQDVRIENGVQFGDLMNYMDFDYLARVARYNVAVIGSLALAPGTPPDAVIVTKGLTNETDLHWTAVPGAARYEIVTRASSEPLWSGAIDAGPSTEIHLMISKDNILFGIRAVDSEGHKSPAAFPLPQR